LRSQAIVRQIERVRAGAPAAARTPCLVLALMSAKGGAGSTFLATSLAAALAARGRRTAVLDLDLAHGDAAVFLSDQPGATTLSDLAAQHARLDGALLESALLACGPELRLLPAPQRLEGAMAIRSESVARIVELAAARFDAVVLDLGRGPDAATLPALDLASSMQVVAPPTLAGLHGARRLLALLRELDVARGRTRLVVNRVGQPGELTATDLRRALGFEEAREIADSPATVASATDHGVPIGRHAPRDPVARALAAWAEELSPELAAESAGARSWLRSLGWPRAAA
jgi:pilus assembly protein CpaE